MADNENMSVDEILAACRGADGEGGGAASSSAPVTEPEATPAPAEKAAPAASSGGKKAGEMSVADMLAAARAEKSGGDGGGSAAETPAAPAEAAPAAAGKKAGEMSVAEMLAAARSEKSADKPAAAKKAAPKKAAPKAAKEAAPKAAKASGPKDTASILAAARGSAKPGPISKAEAARRVDSKPAGKAKLTVPPMPEKPAYAIARPEPAPSSDRRGFFAAFAGVFVGSSLAVGFTSLAITHLLWVLGLARYMFPNILTEPPTQFKVGFPDELAPGQVETKYKAQFGVWIVRSEYDGVPQIYALQSVCTHLGCTPNWLEGEQKFKCPCHGSGFYKDGINFEGPAPRPLERFAIRLADDGQLEVDKSRKFKEEVGQWSDTASYVPV